MADPEIVDKFMVNHPGSYSIQRTYSKWNNLEPPLSSANFILGLFRINFLCIIKFISDTFLSAYF